MTENKQKTYNSMEIRAVINGWHIGFQKEEFDNFKVNVKGHYKMGDGR